MRVTTPRGVVRQQTTVGTLGCLKCNVQWPCVNPPPPPVERILPA